MATPGELVETMASTLGIPGGGLSLSLTGSLRTRGCAPKAGAEAALPE